MLKKESGMAHCLLNIYDYDLKICGFVSDTKNSGR